MSTPKRKIFTAEEMASVADALHHIRTWRGRPYWLKIRIDQGPKFVGKDVYMPLKTKDERVARIVRDLVLVALDAGGFVCLRHEIINHDEHQKGA